MTSRILKVALTASAAVGAAVGAFSFVGAFSGTPAEPKPIPPVQADGVTRSTLLPPTQGNEPIVFGDGISAADDGTSFVDDRVSVKLSRGSASEVCISVTLPDTTSDGCVQVDVIRTGLGYAAYQSHDGPIDVVGVVPDDVTEVVVGGVHHVSVVNNVWHYTGRPGEDLSFTVISADGQIKVSL